MDGLDDDDGIIDDDGNRKDKGTKGQKVDAESDQVEYEERTDQGHRNCDCRDQCRSEILKEDEDDNEHQDKGFDQGLQHFVDGCVKKVARIEQDIAFYSGRKIAFRIFQNDFDIFDNLRGV